MWISVLGSDDSPDEPGVSVGWEDLGQVAGGQAEAGPPRE